MRYRLGRVVARHVEEIAVAEQLWVPCYVWVRRDFVFTFCSFCRTHTACGRYMAVLPCLPT